MRELVIISGKGGTGKTSIAASLAALARPVVLADCDVDAPDLHLVTQPRVETTFAFVGGKKAFVAAEACRGCGRCADACRFDAIREAGGNDIVGLTYTVDAVACEGCGACVLACPADAIQLEPVVNGHWFVSETRFGPMVHARMKAGESNTGKLVSIIRAEAQQRARKHAAALLITDGSPGVGCPVIASLARADLALVVAEPTLTGEHDAVRAMKLAQRMGVPFALTVNRWDLNAERAGLIEEACEALGGQVLGRVREDRAVVNAQNRGLTVVELGDSPAADDIRRLWDDLQPLIGEAEYQELNPHAVR